MSAASGLDAALAKMRSEGLPDIALDTFAHYYRLLESGERGLLPVGQQPADPSATSA